MSYAIEHTLKAVRVEVEGWQATVREQLDSGRNFFIILPDDPDAISRFCRSFDLQSDCLHDRFSRSDLLLMAQYVDGASFDEMLEAWENHALIVFLEQLDFALNRPPHVKHLLVYSPLWGILSQHDNIRSARRGLEEAEPWGDRSLLAHPAIYQWNRSKWRML
jgi:hypothetical protein